SVFTSDSPKATRRRVTASSSLRLTTRVGDWRLSLAFMRPRLARVGEPGRIMIGNAGDLRIGALVIESPHKRWWAASNEIPSRTWGAAACGESAIPARPAGG